MANQLECRIVLEHGTRTFKMGMYDPVGGKFVPLGEHPNRDKGKIVRDLRTRMERERHRVSFCERWV